MKYILILIVTILVSCEDEASKYVRPTPTVKGSQAELDTLSPLYHTHTEIYSYEGCEYIVVGHVNQNGEHIKVIVKTLYIINETI